MAERWARSFFRELLEPEVRTRESLPHPPQGMKWVQDEKRDGQWKLVKEVIVDNEAISEKSKPPPPRHYLMDGLPPRCDSSSSKQQLSAAQQSDSQNNNDWEWLSDRWSQSSSAVMVPRDCNSVTAVSLCNGMKSVPLKFQRTNSNSTIDSADNILGPLGKGILGVDYVEHVVLPTDTLQGICLSYKISSTQLKMANCFSGDNLSLAPKKLVIPISNSALRSGFLRVQDTDQKEYKLHAFLAECADTSIVEAKAYLELADWDLKRAVASAKADAVTEDWNITQRAGDIRILSGSIVGAGIGTKTIPPGDMVHAAPEHAQVGVELKCVGGRS